MAFIGGISAGRCSLLVAKENQKTTSDFDALDPRERGCTPLSTPKKKSKRKNASRFAQRIFFFRFSDLESLRDGRYGQVHSLSAARQPQIPLPEALPCGELSRSD